MTNDIQLRDVIAADLPIFFEQQLDAEANHMAAFTSRDSTDRRAFMAHWGRILGDAALTKQTILAGDQVAGYIVAFELFGDLSVGYWLGRAYWGQGVATRALAAFLRQVPARPLHARVAKHNHGSIRVLEKCGFAIVGEDRWPADEHGDGGEEWILTLAAGTLG